jgi:hypothetical protein
MKKVLVIIGPENSGKLQLAKNICLSSLVSLTASTVLVSGKNFGGPYTFSKCNERTKVIIIDKFQGDLMKLIQKIKSGIIVNKKMAIPFTIKPFVIITTEKDRNYFPVLDSDFNDNCIVISLFKN